MMVLRNSLSSLKNISEDTIKWIVKLEIKLTDQPRIPENRLSRIILGKIDVQRMNTPPSGIIHCSHNVWYRGSTESKDSFNYC